MWCSTVVCIVTFTLSLLVAPLVAAAQPRGKVYRIGLLSEGVLPQPVSLFREALHMLGYVDGHNLVIEQRHVETREQLPALAAELVTRQVDLIVTLGTPATRAAKQGTTTIPIVFNLSADPVQSELVASLARPGGNLTGFAGGLYEDKLLEILKEAVPGVVRVACPCRSGPENLGWVRIVDAARVLGLEIQAIDVHGPDDFERFFAAARHAGADAVLVHNVSWFFSHVTRLAELAAQSRLPAIGYSRQFVEAGGLLSYAPKRGESQHRVAAQVDKILQGGRPADIPVERPIGFELVINLKAARALGLTIPSSLLFRADEVIQ
jgi:putative tryptophan/tyrosine transport system substrate-binding protein